MSRLRVVLGWIVTVLMLVLVIGARSAAAMPVVFTDEAQFNAAVAHAGIRMASESFEGVDAGFYGGLDFPAFTLQPLTPVPLLFVSDEPGVATDGEHAIPTTPIQAPTFAFNTGIHAFSLDIIAALNSNGGDFFVDIDDTFEQIAFSGFDAEDTVRFIGVLDLDAPFSSLTFNSSDFVDIFAIDRVRYEDPIPAAPVPEPASLTLLGAGLIGLIRVRSRARR
jgi:hypothetical protein